MRRLLRILLRSLVVLSLLLFMAVCVLWVRSYWVADDVAWYRDPGASRGYGGNTSDGMVYLWRYMGKPQFAMLPPAWQFNTYEPVNMAVHRMPGPDICRRLGPFVWGGRRIGSDWVDEALFPLWPVALTTVLLPAIGIARWARSTRHLAAGLCLTCGYDLRASPDRCPECGTPTEKQPENFRI